MADIKYMKAVEFDKLPSLFKKTFVSVDVLASKGYWMQRKYDGCFGKATVAFDRAACRMESREGKDYSKSCAYILDALHHTACRQAGSFDTFVVLGEAWMPKTPFPEISGRFRRQTKGPQDLLFVMNDILPEGMETDRPYEDRFSDLVSFADDGEFCCELSLAETFGSHTYAFPMGLAQTWQDEGGFDGGIMRNPSAGYTFGLVKNGEIIKLKPLLELDLEVAGVFHEPGEKTGRMVHTIEVTYRGVTTKVGSGVPHALADLPAVTDIVRIDSLGLTEDGKLREPRYIGIRHDKTEPDA